MATVIIRQEVPDEELEFVTPRQVADECGLTVQAVYQYLTKGQLPSIHTHYHWQIRRTDLDEFKKRPRPWKRGRPGKNQRQT